MSQDMATAVWKQVREQLTVLVLKLLHEEEESRTEAARLEEQVRCLNVELDKECLPPSLPPSLCSASSPSTASPSLLPLLLPL